MKIWSPIELARFAALSVKTGISQEELKDRVLKGLRGADLIRPKKTIFKKHPQAKPGPKGNRKWMFRTERPKTYKVPHGGWMPLWAIARAYNLNYATLERRAAKGLRGEELVARPYEFQSKDKRYQEKIEIVRSYGETIGSLAAQAEVEYGTILARIRALDAGSLRSHLDLLKQTDRRIGPRTEAEKIKKQKTTQANALRRELGLKSRT